MDVLKGGNLDKQPDYLNRVLKCVSAYLSGIMCSDTDLCVFGRAGEREVCFIIRFKGFKV